MYTIRVHDKEQTVIDGVEFAIFLHILGVGCFFDFIEKVFNEMVDKQKSTPKKVGINVKVGAFLPVYIVFTAPPPKKTFIKPLHHSLRPESNIAKKQSLKIHNNCMNKLLFSNLFFLDEHVHGLGPTVL